MQQERIVGGDFDIFYHVEVVALIKKSETHRRSKDVSDNQIVKNNNPLGK